MFSLLVYRGTLWLSENIYRFPPVRRFAKTICRPRMPLKHSLLCHRKEECLWKEGQIMSLFSFICEMDGGVLGTKKVAPKPFERWKGLSWNKVSWKITNQSFKMSVQIKWEQRTIRILQLKCLIRILTACRGIILTPAFGIDSSYRKRSKFSYLLIWTSKLCID